MGEEEFVFMMMMVVGAGLLGYWVGKARAAKDYLERLNDYTRMQGRPAERSSEEGELSRLRATLEGISHRFDLMEQRVDFTERLVENAQRKSLARTEEDWVKGR